MRVISLTNLRKEAEIQNKSSRFERRQVNFLREALTEVPPTSQAKVEAI